MTRQDVERFEEVIAAGGVALFPADTVYGLATHPGSRDGVERINEMKGRPPAKPSAVMAFSTAELPPLAPRLREAAERLLPGPVTLVVPNPEGLHPLACGPVPERLGIRVPAVPRPLADARVTVLQTSANRSGEQDARSLAEVDPALRAAVDCVLDGGTLPGTPSTVIDLSSYEEDGSFEVLREGALTVARVEELLRSRG
ncbi:MAG TPA: L-threonylcarbamoyladenylate synthase [Thermoleophilaceae bacterium]|nr:L-threonylcarbamoyladenylate synthase [Thermoleophilaceae bacterium]